jgi:hypothetical protein
MAGHAKFFTEIFQRNIWGYQETVSGGGSTLHYTRKLRETLPELIGDLDIGADIVPRLVETAHPLRPAAAGVSHA